MTAADIGAVMDIAARLHPDNYERPEVFLGQLAVYSDGCRILQGPNGAVGYGFAHPARAFQPPALGTVPDGLCDSPQCLHLHDIAVLPEARGSRATARFLDWLRLLARRDGLEKLALVAVNDSLVFWSRQGFSPAHDPALDAILASYCGGATYMVADIAQ